MHAIIIISDSAPMYKNIGHFTAHSSEQLSKFEKDFENDLTARFIERRGTQMLQERGLSHQVTCKFRHFHTDTHRDLANSGVVLEFENEQLTPTLELLARELLAILDNLVDKTAEKPMEIDPLQLQIPFDTEAPLDRTIFENEAKELHLETNTQTLNPSKANSLQTATSVELSPQHVKKTEQFDQEEEFRIEKKIIQELLQESKRKSIDLTDSAGVQHGTFVTHEHNTKTKPVVCNAWIIGIQDMQSLTITVKFVLGEKTITKKLALPVNCRCEFFNRLKSMERPTYIECRATIEYNGRGETAEILAIAYP